MDRRIMYGLFLPLYMSQYLGIGFLFTALAAITRERGGDLEEIGVIYVLGMVWAVKFLWAPLVDRFGSRRLGHYRSWLLVTQPATALAVVMIAPFDVLDNLGLIIAALAVVAILSSTQDIATDALAVRTMRGSGRGGVNGLQVGAGFVGDIIGGGGVLVVYDLFGWVPAVLTLAAITAIPVYFIKRFREPVFDEPVEPVNRVRRKSIRTLFRRPGLPRWMLVVTPLLSLGMPGATALLAPILIDSGMTIGLVGLLTNVAGGVISIGAALVAGSTIQRLGRKRALVIYGAGQVVAIASVLPLAATGAVAWALVAIVLVNVFTAASYVAMYTVNMDNARPESAGSDFTLQVSISYFVRFAITGMVVGMAGSLGYAPALFVCLALGVVGVLAALTLFTERADAPVEPARPEPAALPQAA